MNRSVSLPVAFCVSLLALAGCNESKAPEDTAKADAGTAISTDAQRMGYSLGASMGRQFRNDKLQVDADALARGVREGFTADKLALTDEEVTAGMQQLQKSHSERMQAEQKAAADKNLAEGEAFLKDNAAKEGVVTTESGLQYKIVTAGEGPKPGAEDVVKVHYRGTLIDGTEFDSSYKRGEPVTFPVGGVIPGKIEKMGYKGVDTTEMIFEGAKISAEQILGGEPGKGFYQMMDGVEVGRVNVAARAVGVANRAFELGISYAQQRETFGKKIAEHQAVLFRLAEMGTKVEAAHGMVVTAARKKDKGERNDLEAGMAKYLASEYCSQVVEDSFRIHGGYGFSKEYEIERLYREAPMLLIGEGTADIQRMIIGRRLLEDYKL